MRRHRQAWIRRHVRLESASPDGNQEREESAIDPFPLIGQRARLSVRATSGERRTQFEWLILLTVECLRQVLAVDCSSSSSSQSKEGAGQKPLSRMYLSA